MTNKKPLIENPDKKLNPVLYAIWDRVFMYYGSTMNSLQHIITKDNWEEISRTAWALAQEEVEELIYRLYGENELPVVKTEEEEEAVEGQDLDLPTQ